ncbi:MAG: hypothetical protein ISR65_10595 [Bacteriovoracaceae bacterium]|nr:hypothetical protein [Bacteriovoracaceae bacterium]
MKSIVFLSTLLFIFIISNVGPLNAQDITDSYDDKHAAEINDMDHDKLRDELKDNYQMDDKRIDELRGKGMSYSGIMFSSDIARQSGKRVEDIAKMRMEDKKGWGKIAKDVGVKRSGLKLGHLKHDKKDRKGKKGKDRDKDKDKHEKRKDKHEKRKGQHEKRKDRHDQRKEKRDKRKEHLKDKRKEKHERKQSREHRPKKPRRKGH